VRLRLDPPTLGEVQVQISLSDASVDVRIVTESTESRALLADCQPQLRHELERFGLSLRSFSADVGDGAWDGGESTRGRGGEGARGRGEATAGPMEFDAAAPSLGRSGSGRSLDARA
jgi:flagellar hook-length control protein FliK